MTEDEELKRPANTSPSPSFCGIDQCGECPRKRVDFVRQLPVQISKKILGYMSEKELGVLVFVSKHWSFLVQQVHKEFILKQVASEDIMMMQVMSL